MDKLPLLLEERQEWEQRLMQQRLYTINEGCTSTKDRKEDVNSLLCESIKFL